MAFRIGLPKARKTTKKTDMATTAFIIVLISIAMFSQPNLT
jgi:hypothetical protein